MSKRTIDFDKWLLEKLKDPKEAQGFLEISFEEYEKDDDNKTFLSALRFVVEAHGGLGKLARKTKLSRQHLYKVLSSRGNPQMSTVLSIMNALGFQISIKIKKVA